MSVDINWETLTQGPHGAALAETIRVFIHDRFQLVSLPKLIRSVKVHSFDFGDVAPEVVLKDIGDPLPDFYEDDEEDDDEDPQEDLADETDGISNRHHISHAQATHHMDESRTLHFPQNGSAKTTGPHFALDRVREEDQMSNATISRGATPGILGGTSNLGYFHLPLSAGLSGTNTPLAAVAGAQFRNSRSEAQGRHHHSTSLSSLTPSSTDTTPSRPTSRDHLDKDRRQSLLSLDGQVRSQSPGQAVLPEPSPEDLQVVTHVTYSGNIKLSLTAEILLDYPMPSFVSIPLKLTVTGIAFDGVAILAYIKKRAHFCFLSPEDAEALIGAENDLAVNDDGALSAQDTTRNGKVGGLLEEIKVESEIGQKENGKQVLKNVGKVEKFILEQVRRIFEDEFVYPSFWTFLV